jgi:hypothetical protein
VEQAPRLSPEAAREKGDRIFKIAALGLEVMWS